jgi:hypothetical protein
MGGVMSMASDNPFRPPTDEEIAAAELRLGLAFHPDYRAFLRGGGDVADATLEPAVILPGSGHLDLFEIADTAWNLMGVPRDLLPFVEDNGDYYCIDPSGEVVYWSHNGITDEKWPTIAAWRQQVCVERL